MNNYRILIIDDEAGVRVSLAMALSAVVSKKIMEQWEGGERPDFTLEIAGVETLADGEVEMQSKEWEAVLIDLNLTDSQEAQTIQWIKDNAKRLRFPLLALTGSTAPDILWTCLRSGAFAFIHKRELEHDMAQILRKILFASEKYAYLVANGWPLTGSANSSNLTT